jgi:hypothetical protein
MPNNIQDFKSTLRGGGARPNLFEVLLTDIPGGGDFSSKDFGILCKAAQLPASNIASIDVPFRGRIFKVAGDRTFDTWTVTVINDEDFRVRTAMEQWMQFIGQYGDASGSTEPGSYMREATVRQLTRNASTTGPIAFGGDLSVTAQYKFYDIFPTNISAIDLSYDTADTIEEFTVEFQVQYWTPFTGQN